MVGTSASIYKYDSMVRDQKCIDSTDLQNALVHHAETTTTL